MVKGYFWFLVKGEGVMDLPSGSFQPAFRLLLACLQAPSRHTPGILGSKAVSRLKRGCGELTRWFQASTPSTCSGSGSATGVQVSGFKLHARMANLPHQPLLPLFLIGE